MQLGDRLTRRSLPHFGQLTLAALLLCAAALAAYFLRYAPHGQAVGPRNGPVTIFSFLPDALLLSVNVQRMSGAVFYANALLWGFRRGVPWSGWLTALGFTGVVGLYVENHVQVSHTSHVTCMFLWLYALWYHVEAGPIRRSTADGTFWRTPLFPAWVHTLGVFYLGLFYGLSGWTKLLTSGFGWANGVSMQLWVNMWGDPDSPFTALILRHRWMATLLQAATLVAECAAPLALVSRRLRPVLGLMLISFHVGAISVFRWGFHANAVMLALHFLPARDWIEKWRERRSRGDGS